MISLSQLSRAELEARVIALRRSLDREILMRQAAEEECRQLAHHTPDREAAPVGA